MSEHNYIRVKKTGGWDINNVDNIDVNGKQITLASEIKTALPGKLFQVCSDGIVCLIKFVDQLTAAEITTLDGVVAAHKAITGTVVADKAARVVERDNLRGTWDGLKATDPYLTGPFEHKFQEVNTMLDSGRDAEAEAVIQYAEAPTSYDASQVTVFDAVKAQMLLGIQGLTQV